MPHRTTRSSTAATTRPGTAAPITTSTSVAGLAKVPTGIAGIDEVTLGGLPRGRPTLVCGGPGSGKTLFAVEFIVRGALEYGEPGVFVTFEESAAELTANVASLGFDLDAMVEAGLLAVEEIRMDPTMAVQAGAFDLEALFIRLGMAIDSVGARRIALDTMETLFAALPDPQVIRAELVRLFGWLKARGLTAVVTAEKGDGVLTRDGLEEYVADCVMLLDHRVYNEISTRRLRVLKYRGSYHGTNEYPFLIGPHGLSVMPITSLQLEHEAWSDRIGSGVARIDAMLGGGVYRGTSILVTGGAGSGKSSLAASFADAACRRGERVLSVSYEESPRQTLRNMRSIGLDLERHRRAGLLRLQTARPTLYGLETHLATLHALVDEFDPALVVIDPINELTALGGSRDALSANIRLIDFLKGRGITAVFTAMGELDPTAEAPELGVSSLMDTWIGLFTMKYAGERNRCIAVLKSRGTSHSNQLREFLITDEGLDVVEAYSGGGEVLTGSARLAQTQRERYELEAARRDAHRARLDLELRQRETTGQMDALGADLVRIAEELGEVIKETGEAEVTRAADRGQMSRLRGNLTATVERPRPGAGRGR